MREKSNRPEHNWWSTLLHTPSWGTHTYLVCLLKVELCRVSVGNEVVQPPHEVPDDHYLIILTQQTLKNLICFLERRWELDFPKASLTRHARTVLTSFSPSSNSSFAQLILELYGGITVYKGSDKDQWTAVPGQAFWSFLTSSSMPAGEGALADAPSASLGPSSLSPGLQLGSHSATLFNSTVLASYKDTVIPTVVCLKCKPSTPSTHTCRHSHSTLTPVGCSC